MKLPLQPNITMASTFLAGMHPDTPWNLVAIKEHKGPIAKTFHPDQIPEAESWIAKQNNNKANIHWHVNQLSDTVTDRKAKKPDVAKIVAFHVDVDDPSETALLKIQNYFPKPSVVIFSGGGYQAFWLLQEPMTDFEKAETINQTLARDLGGDNCHNVDRIMRVPGTINWPNAKKRSAGRGEALAYVL